VKKSTDNGTHKPRRTRRHCSGRTPHKLTRPCAGHNSAPGPAHLQNPRRRSPNLHCKGGQRSLCQHEVRSRSKNNTHQSVVSKMAECELKKVNGLQPVADQNAIGVPHVSGSGALAVMSAGIELRGKKNTEIPESSHCTVQSQLNAKETRRFTY
jgi:hypothetical protein